MARLRKNGPQGRTASSRPETGGGRHSRPLWRLDDGARDRVNLFGSVFKVAKVVLARATHQQNALCHDCLVGYSRSVRDGCANQRDGFVDFGLRVDDGQRQTLSKCQNALTLASAGLECS